MKRTCAGIVALPLLVAAACAGSEDAAPSPPAPEPDASIPPATDAGGPAELDAAVEAGPSLCSIHGFCHTELPGEQHLEGVWGDGTGIVWAVSAEGNVLRWDGTTWKIHARDLGALHAVWGSDPNDVWVGGDLGLYHGTPASSPTSDGLAFAPSPTPGDSVSITSIWGSGAGDVWAVGRLDIEGADPDGEVLHYTNTDAGPAWELDPISENHVAYSHVWGGTSGTWVAGSRQIENEWSREIAVFRKTTGAFEEVTLPPNPDQDPLFGRIGTLHAALSPEPKTILLLAHTIAAAPGVWRGSSTDGQSFSWTFVADGRFDEPSLNGAFATAANDVWAVGDYGRVRHWDGTSWTPKAITSTNVPVIDPLHAVWSGGTSDVWIVGSRIALRYDPTQKKDGGAK